MIIISYWGLLMLRVNVLVRFLFVFCLFVFLNPCFAATELQGLLSDPAAVQAGQNYLATQDNSQNSEQPNSNDVSSNTNVDVKKLVADKTTDKNSKIIGKNREYLSILEESFSQSVSLEGFMDIKQFGYDIFNKSSKNFVSPSKNTPVGANYVIGPGDSFDVSMWGVSEGTFKLTVNSNGEITLPKVGLVAVAGISYSQLKPFIESQLNRYYQGINIGITFDTIKTIQVYIVGEVAQPGSYPLSSLSTAFNALFYAGGPTKNGSLRDVRILRNGKIVARLDLYKFLLKGDNSQDIALMAGDTVFVPLIGSVVAVAGNVNRPAIYEIKGTTDLSDVLSLAGGVNASGNLSRIQIERTIAHEKKLIVDKEIPVADASANLDIPVQNMDFVKIFPIYDKVNNKIFVKGSVKYPGSYEFKEGIRILDILNEDSFLPDYYFPKIEVSRVINDPTFRTDVYAVDYNKLFKEKEDAANLLLQPDDIISVFASSKEAEQITIQGQVKCPGEYSIRDGEKLSSLIERAGGYTESAFLYGAILTRKNVQDVEQENYGSMLYNLELDLMRKENELSSGFVAKEDIATRQAAFEKTKQIVNYMRSKSMSLKGRVIVQLDNIEKFKYSKNDIEVEDGDILFIPKTPKSIIVLGQVYNPTAVSYDQNKKTRDYVNMAGGTTRNASESDSYIIRANGSVVSGNQGVSLFSIKLFPGDTVIVPEKLDTRTFFTTVQDFTHWLYEAVVSVIVITKVLN